MKLRLIIIDDEVFVRKGIISSIDWSKHDIEIVGEAIDGNTGLEVIRNTRPHIVITDIRMPYIDGLQLIKIVQQELPDTKFLILSVMEEFQTVREALQLGVIDYIPKLSMTPEELLVAVLKIKVKWQNEMEQHLDHLQQTQKPDLDSQLDPWMAGEVLDHYDELVKQSQGYLVGVVNVKGRYDHPVTDWEKTGSIVINAIQHSELKGIISSVMLIKTIERQIYLLILLNSQCQTEDVRAQLIHVIHRLKPQLIISMGISDVYVNAVHRKKALDQAERALEQQFYYDEGVYSEPVNRNSIQAIATEPDVFFDKRVLAHYFSLLGLEDETLSSDVFLQLFPDRISEVHPQKLLRDEIHHWVYSVSLYVKERGGMLSSVLGEESSLEQIGKLSTYFEIRDWCYRLHSVVQTMLNNLRSTHRHEIHKSIEYMKSHYMNTIRVKEVAEMVYLSENYFSYLFTKETGITFSQYLLGIRIEKTKELLQLNSCSWIQAGEQVGFYNPKYFTKVFKKSTGITPKQYEKSKK